MRDKKLSACVPRCKPHRPAKHGSYGKLSFQRAGPRRSLKRANVHLQLVGEFGQCERFILLAVMCDGEVRTLDLKKISAKTLKLAIDPADGNPLGQDWDNARPFRPRR